MPGGKLKMDPIRIVLMKLESMDAKIDMVTNAIDKMYGHLQSEQDSDENSFSVVEPEKEVKENKKVKEPEVREPEVILTEEEMIKLKKKIERSNKGRIIELVD
tara:strand:- start:258 stop:566 length:309 start_codon:yes stop_codon:yes gene_type:complete